MRALLIVMTLSISPLASAQGRMTLGPRADSGATVATWLAERVANARRGTRDLVQAFAQR